MRFKTFLVGTSLIAMAAAPAMAQDTPGAPVTGSTASGPPVEAPQPPAAPSQAANPAAGDAVVPPDVPEAAAPAAGDDTNADIVVTGTSIRGVAPVGSSLIAVGRSEIDQSAATSVTRILQETPQVLNYGISDSSRNGAGGAGNIAYGTSVNIRGVGPYATLALVNGRRAVPQGTNGASIDPSALPTIALERVEIVADGASAIYGSDAVAGVANLILRRNYQGAEISAQHGIGADYHETQLSAIAGTKWATGQLTASFQHTYRTALSGLDRDFYQSDLTSRGGSDYRVSLCAPGNIVAGGASYAIPATGATATNLVRGTTNRCDNVKFTDILPQQEVNGGALTFDQKLADGINFYVDAYANRRNAFRRSAVVAQSLTVPSSNAFFVAPAGVTLPACAASVGAPAGSRCETVQYSFRNDFGPNALATVRSDTWQATAGVTADLFGDFRLDVYGTAGYNHDHVYSIGTNTNAAALAAALASSNPLTAFNPFGTSVNNPEIVSAIFNNVTDTDGRSRLRAAEAQIDGSLFTLPAGAMRIAVGAEYYQLKLRTGQIRGPIGAQTGTDQRLSRDVKSAYVELFVPLVAEGNDIPFIHSLDLDLAGRIDDYSDVGSTKNPKIGINWRPVRSVKLHGSYGESFRAPLLTQIVSSGGSQLYIQNYFDPTANNGAGATVQGVALSGNGLNLRPETARTWSAGIDFTPDVLPGALASLNYFDLVYKGQIAGYLSNLNVLRQESLYSSIIQRGAAAQTRIAELVGSGLFVNGGSTTAALAAPVFIDGRGANLGTTITRGLDFAVQVPIRTADAGDFRASLRGTRFFTYKVAITPGGRVIDQLNNLDYPLKLRMRGQLGWNKAGFDASIVGNYQNGYNNTLFTPAQRIKSYTTVDLRFTYDLERTGIPGTEGVRIGLDATNVFDRQPPFVDIAPTNNGGGGFDPQASNPIGRLVSFSIAKRF